VAPLFFYAKLFIFVAKYADQKPSNSTRPNYNPNCIPPNRLMMKKNQPEQEREQKIKAQCQRE
jgi:hypothetical protein